MSEECKNYPYDDDLMKFDELTHQYVLKEAALLACGVDVRARILATSTIAPEVVIQNLLDTTSDMIYQYIHDQSMDNDTQDYLIAHNQKLRRIICRAMQYQAKYICFNGNLSLSTDDGERQKAVDMTAKSLLDNVICPFGSAITFRGEW